MVALSGSRTPFFTFSMTPNFSRVSNNQTFSLLNMSSWACPSTLGWCMDSPGCLLSVRFTTGCLWEWFSRIKGFDWFPVVRSWLWKTCRFPPLHCPWWSALWPWAEYPVQRWENTHNYYAFTLSLNIRKKTFEKQQMGDCSLMPVQCQKDLWGKFLYVSDLLHLLGGYNLLEILLLFESL